MSWDYQVAVLLVQTITWYKSKRSNAQKDPVSLVHGCSDPGESRVSKSGTASSRFSGVLHQEMVVCYDPGKKGTRGSGRYHSQCCSSELTL